jgi:transcription elongation factor Elf1
MGIKITCPHCGSKKIYIGSTFGTFGCGSYNKEGYTVRCKDCNYMFDLVIKKYDAYNKLMNEKHSEVKTND